MMIKRFRPFQIRWAEPLGLAETPYLYRYTFLFFNFSIRIHHWIGSDVGPHLHDHASNFISICLRGHYYNIGKNGRKKIMAGQIWYSNALTQHRLEIPKCGAWTLLFCGRPYNKWGFFINGEKLSPKKYFTYFRHQELTNVYK